MEINSINIFSLQSIAHIAKIETHLTFYMARHTYANTLKQKKASISQISKSMGHRNVDITKRYLKKLGNEELDWLDDLL